MAVGYKRRYWFHLPLSLFLGAAPFAVGVFAHLPPLARLFFFVSSFVLYFLVRRSLRTAISTAPFLERDRQQRTRWDEIRNEWGAKASPRLFEEKKAELEKLRATWSRLKEVEAAPENVKPRRRETGTTTENSKPGRTLREGFSRGPGVRRKSRASSRKVK